MLIIAQTALAISNGLFDCCLFAAAVCRRSPHCVRLRFTWPRLSSSLPDPDTCGIWILVNIGLPIDGEKLSLAIGGQ